MDETRALIIVDVQPTFCEGGALAVQGGNAVAERIADFVTDNADEYALIVTTQDWHVDPGAHFSDTPDLVDSWPPHGVAGTPEAELHDAVASLPVDVSVKKGEYSAAYSGFEGVDADARGLEEILREAEIQAVDVVGLAESHCVKDTALDALRAGWPTRVLTDLTAPVSAELGRAAREEMDEAGVELVASSAAFGFYDEGEDTPIPGDFDSGFEGDVYGDDSYEDDSFGSGYGSDSYDEDSYGGSHGGDYDDFGGFSSEADDPDEDDFEDDDLEDFSDLGGAAGMGAAGIGGSSQPAGLAERITSGLFGLGASATEDVDFDFDDFDLDEEMDFSADADESDFDFSDIDYKPGM